jgi:hypothetical protein
MVRQAVRQAHGPEQRRWTHHPEPSRRTIFKSESPKIPLAPLERGETCLVFDSLYFGICLEVEFCNLGFD